MIGHAVVAPKSLRRPGIDEISYKCGHRYLTVVVDHDTGRLVWTAPGGDKAPGFFFQALGEERCKLITHVSVDGADSISAVFAEHCPNAVRCAEPFHSPVGHRRAGRGPPSMVKPGPWRGQMAPWRRASRQAKAIKHAPYALWKNPENLTTRQQTKLAWVAKTDPKLHWDYLLEEGLRLVFQLPCDEAAEAPEP